MTTDAETSKWIRRHHVRRHAAIRLFCLPYAGGGASVFNDWGSELSAEVELCSVQLPGRENRVSEAPLRRLDDLVERLSDVAAPLLDRPFMVFGHSMGGRLAFEWARELRARKLPQPLHLFVSGIGAPHISGDSTPFHREADDAFVDKLHKLGGMTKAVLEHSELMHILLPTIRADFELIETAAFKSEPPLECDFSAFGGSTDAFVSKEAIRAWAEHTRGKFFVRLFPDGHFFIHSSKSELLAEIRAVIDGRLARPCTKNHRSG